jgi:hypothetical protein
MDRMLEMAFCALVASMYAVILASGQNTSWLIDRCQDLAKADTDLDETERAAIDGALRGCRAAGKRRGDLVHSIFEGGDIDSVMAFKGSQKSHRVTVTRVTLIELSDVVSDLVGAGQQLMRQVIDALGTQSLLFYEELRRHDVAKEIAGHDPRPGR